ncbi:hypothetical protein KKA47_01620, partial [bacterium]|nr:hypothetical protein [bacterium]
MNFYNLIANLQISMDPSTDRGDNISYSEKVNIANDSPDIPMELIDDLAEMLNERDGNAFFSSQDVEKIKNKYPKIAADLLQVIKNNCKWSGIVKIFADDVPEELKGACQNDVDAIVDALNKIGFKVERDTFNHILPKFMIKEYVKGCIETVNNEEFVSFAKTFMSNFGCIKNWNIYDASKIISIFQNDSTAGVAFREMLLSREFGGFVKFMNDEYGMKVLSETSMGADIFTDPNKLSRWKDPRNINMYRKLNERYHFQNNRRFMNRDIDTIEKIRGFKNIDELLDEVDWMVEAYRKNESNVGIRDAGTVLSFMQSANQPEHRKKFQDFERKEVRKINEFLRENFGFVLSVFNMTERCMKAVLFFSNNPEVLLVLKNYPQRLIRSAITGALAPEEVQVLLPQMNDAWVRKTFFEFDSYAGWDSIEDIIVYSKHPHREEVLEMAKRFGLDFVDSVKNVFTLRDSEDGWEIFLTILEKCPKVSIDFDNSQDATWLISDEAIYFMENGEFQRMYEAIIEGVDLKTIRLDVIIEVLALPEQNKNLVHNKSFIDKAKKFFELADSGDKFGEYEICKYLEIGESGVDILLSDEVQDAILAVKANTSLAIDFLDLDPFLKFIAKGGCQLMIRLAELKLFRKEGFYRFYEFSSLIEACPDILQKLNDEKIGTFLTKAVNEDLIYLRDLKDMGSFLEIGHAPEIIENLKGVKQIIDRSIVKKDLFFLNKLLKDEIKSKILQDEGFIKFCKMTGE